MTSAVGSSSKPVYFDANGTPKEATTFINKVGTIESNLSNLQGDFNNDVAALDEHVSNTEIHVIGADKTKWNGYEIGKSNVGHTHTVTYTPSGTISSTFTGNSATSGGPSGTVSVASSSHTHEYTPSGSVSQPTFTGSAGTATATYTPSGTISTPTFTGTKATISANYTPAGTISTPTFTGQEVTTGASDSQNIYSITGVGSLPSVTYTAPSLTASVSNKCLTLTFSQGSHSFSAGSLPTRSQVSVSSGGHTHKVTAKGTVSTPVFSGNADTLSVEFTPSGTVSAPTFTGQQATISSSYTPAGVVSKPSFTGTKGTTTSISGTTSVSTSAHTHNVTAKGTIVSSLSGTEVTLTTSSDN